MSVWWVIARKTTDLLKQKLYSFLFSRHFVRCRRNDLLFSKHLLWPNKLGNKVLLGPFALGDSRGQAKAAPWCTLLCCGFRRSWRFVLFFFFSVLWLPECGCWGISICAVYPLSFHFMICVYKSVITVGMAVLIYDHVPHGFTWVRISSLLNLQQEPSGAESPYDSGWK